MDSQQSSVPEPLHFKNPPIVEAVIAIDVSLLPESILEQFRSLVAQMGEFGYNTPMPVSRHHFQIKINAGDSIAETRDIDHGLRFDSSDGLHAVQFNRTGFIFSRLGKYETWDLFRDEAKKLWHVYSAEIGPAELKDYGVRYINKVFLPNDEDYKDYLQIYPHLPGNIPGSIQECFMRLGMPIADPQGKLVHQQILLAPEKDNYSTVLLDNDFRFSAIGLSSTAVWERLEKIRQIKDDYFRKFVTEKLMETFNA